MQQPYRVRKIIIEKVTREDVPASLMQDIRYVDPIMWPSLLGIYELLQLLDQRPRPNEVALIHCGNNRYPKIASHVALREGSMSGSATPFHFAAVNATESISMICSIFHFNGPTMSLSSPVEKALLTMETIIQYWFHQNIKSIFVIKQDQLLTAQVEHVFVCNEAIEK